MPCHQRTLITRASRAKRMPFFLPGDWASEVVPADETFPSAIAGGFDGPGQPGASALSASQRQGCPVSTLGNVRKIKRNEKKPGAKVYGGKATSQDPLNATAKRERERCMAGWAFVSTNRGEVVSKLKGAFTSQAPIDVRFNSL